MSAARGPAGATALRARRADPARHGVLAVQATALAVVAVLLIEDAGYAMARWAPAVLVAVALLAFAATALPAPPRPSRPVAVALAGLAATVAWSYLSILWAGVPGEAWTGSNRQLGYLVLLTLFALWPPGGRGALVLVGALTGAIALLGLVTLAGLRGGAPEGAFVSTRLAGPTGYPNAAAVLWMMGAWPAVALAASREVPWWGRGPAAGAAVLLAVLALLAQSRGAVAALPLVALVALVALPGRVRLAAALAVVGGGVALATGPALDVGPAVEAASGDPTAPGPTAALDAVVRATLLAAGVAALVVVAWALGEPRAAGTPSARRAWHRGGAVVGGLAAAAVLVGGLGALGDPVQRLDAAWTSFKGGYDEGAAASGSRFGLGLGSERYAFYVAALDGFRERPLAGDGTDNFRERYLARPTGSETPRYPHSLPLRVLQQTGVVGAVLFLAFAAGALLAAWTAARRAGAAGAAARAAVVGVLVFLVHGSADWFWEIAGLGAAAAVLLGVACAPHGHPRPGPPAAGRAAGVAAVVLAATAATTAVGLPYLADRDVARAGAVFGQRPAEALARLDRAARLDPLGLGGPLGEGTARLRLGDVAGADAAFAMALRRAPDDQYATLARGAIASARGRRRQADRLLRRAVALAPRDDVARAALEAHRRDRVDLGALQVALLERATL